MEKQQTKESENSLFSIWKKWEKNNLYTYENNKKELREKETKEAIFLKRVKNLEEVFYLSSFYNLLDLLNQDIKGEWDKNYSYHKEELALLAGLTPLLRAKEDLFTMLGKANYSELRFMLLLRQESKADLFIHLKRAISFIKGEASIINLVQDILEKQNYKRNWAERFFSSLGNIKK